MAKAMQLERRKLRFLNDAVVIIYVSRFLVVVITPLLPRDGGTA